MKKVSLNNLLRHLQGARKELEETANGKLHFDRFRRAYEPLGPEEWILGLEGIEIEGTTSASHKGLCEHIADLKDLEVVLQRVIDKTGRGRPRGTKAGKTRELDVLIIRVARALWKKTGKPPGISTDTMTGEAYGALVDRVIRARYRKDDKVSATRIRDAYRRLKKDPEIIATGLFTHDYDNRPLEEIYAPLLKKGN